MNHHYQLQLISPEWVAVGLGLLLTVTISGLPVTALFGSVARALSPLLAF